MRAHITGISTTCATANSDDGKEVRIQLLATPFAHLLQTMREGDTINIIGGHEARGTLTPDIIVLEPDMLVDVTTLCSCMRNYGFNALSSMIARYESRETTWQIQLGNLAGEMFDACAGETEPDFRRTVSRSFHNNPLVYTALDGIDKGFFYDAQQQFENIRQTVTTTLPTLGIHPQDIHLEPQFLSPELGLQGRLDALCTTAEGTTIIELKSGKADEFHGGRAKEEHELQMLLYKEIMHHTIGIPPTRIRNLLFYSRYPKLLPIHHTMHQLQTAIAVRNDLVALDRATREGHLADIIGRLHTDDFADKGKAVGKLWTNYQRPVIERFLQRMQNMEELEHTYFHRFAQFIAREQHACKIAFARTWLTPLDTQEAEGEAAGSLTLHPISDIEGSITELRADTPHDLSQTNFRCGDMVMLSEEQGRGQTIRCQILSIGNHSLHLALAYKQRSDRMLHLDKPYAVTHAYMEATFTQAYRGLTALLDADADRRALLLGKRRPKQGEYFLLVGPPGTGKTNVHLRRMVREHLDNGHTLLLMAYTNQAVDEICGVLEEECPEIYARIGNENSCGAAYRRRMIQSVSTEAANRQQITEIIGRLRVVTGTIASMTSHKEIFTLIHFDLTIIDEASQVLEPQILPLLCRVGSFVLIGDHKQLPAVVVQDREQCEVNDKALRDIHLTNCANSYFERLYTLQKEWGLEGITTATLHKQGRMHPAIMAFANEQFYGGQLDIVPVAHQLSQLPYPAPRLQFIDSSQRGNIGCTEKTNLTEAHIVAGTIHEIQQTYAAYGMTLNPAKTIGIIVPFRAQITAIRTLIADRKLAEQITIDTVERYQGSQRDIIIFCTVVTEPSMLDMISEPVMTADGTAVDRKLNVALTRARERLIVVGHRPTLLRSEIYAALIEHLEAAGQDGEL